MICRGTRGHIGTMESQREKMMGYAIEAITHYLRLVWFGGQGSEFGLQSSVFTVEGLGFRVWSLGFWVLGQGSGFMGELAISVGMWEI